MVGLSLVAAGIGAAIMIDILGLGPRTLARFTPSSRITASCGFADNSDP